MSRYTAQLSAAQRAYDQICDCCGHVEHEPAPVNWWRTPAAMPMRRFVREKKGRPMGVARTFRDPILGLSAARRRTLVRDDQFIARNVAYGALVSRVCSPVCLPGESK